MLLWLFESWALVSARPHEFCDLEEVVGEMVWSPWVINMKYLEFLWYQGPAYTYFLIHWINLNDLDTDIDPLAYNVGYILRKQLWHCLKYLHSYVSYITAQWLSSFEITTQRKHGVHRVPNVVEMSRDEEIPLCWSRGISPRSTGLGLLSIFLHLFPLLLGCKSLPIADAQVISLWNYENKASKAYEKA